MTVGKQLALLVCLISSVQALIESYPLTDGLLSGIENCDLLMTGQSTPGINRQLLALYCPKLNTFEIYLAEHTTNTTLADIENLIIGDDDLVKQDDVLYNPDQIRKIVKTDITDIVFYGKSHETVVDDAIFIVYRNTTSGENNHYSSIRFHKDSKTNSLVESHVTEFTTDGSISNLFLFDDYMLAIIDDNSVQGIYFKIRGDQY
jgi:hypothetical protein